VSGQLQATTWMGVKILATAQREISFASCHLPAAVQFLPHLPVSTCTTNTNVTHYLRKTITAHSSLRDSNSGWN